MNKVNLAMGQDIYFLIYGLIEALILCLVATAFFGFKWRKYRKERLRSELAWGEILDRLDEEVEALQKNPQRRPELRPLRLACFKAFAAPLEHGQVGDPKVWHRAIDELNQSLDEIVPHIKLVEPALAPKPQTIASEAEKLEQPKEDLSEDAAETPFPELDTKIDLLLSQHGSSMEVLYASQKVADDLKQKCDELRLANQNLRMKVEAIAKQNRSGQLQQTLDEMEKNGVCLKEVALANTRHNNNLKFQLDELGQQIRDFQLSIVDYRKLEIKLLGDRHYLLSENEELSAQLKGKNKLIDRLNGKIEVLRREYTILYESTH